ncbi:MAG: hypothetical protein LBQ54_12155 [Planctomycetaceae bacterium]|nr:hypothetical protein [Planctomycetaceae bacterium]
MEQHVPRSEAMTRSRWSLVSASGTTLPLEAEREAVRQVRSRVPRCRLRCNGTLYSTACEVRCSSMLPAAYWA